MGFLNESLEQIRDLFNSMTRGARITAGLLLVVIVVSLVFLFQGTMTGADNFLLGGRAFSVAELEAIEAAFAKAGLSNYELEGNRVRIPASKKADYVAALAENNALPDNFSDILDREKGGGSVFENKEQAQQRWRTAKQQELALIISHMKGISLAQVIYDEVDKRGFPRKTEKTATVAVQAVGNAELEEHQIRAVRHLVSAAFAGLNHEDVTVTDLNTGVSHGGGDAMDSVEEDPYYERKRFYEKLWRDKIKNALAFVPGAEVTVEVKLSTDTLMREDTVSVDPKPVTLQSNTTEKTSTNSRLGPGGRPGLASQQSNGSANQGSSIAGATNESTVEEAQESIRKLSGHTRTVRDSAALVPERVMVAVGIPSSYYEKIWRERNPTPEGEDSKDPDPQELIAIENAEVKKIEDMLVNLIPTVDKSEDKFPMVKVKTFQHLTNAPVEPPSAAQSAGVWLADNWSTLGMMLVGAFGLLMLRSMVRQRPAPPPAAPEAESPTPSLSVVSDEEEEDEPEAEPKPRRKKRFASAGANIKDELASMVRENPDAAANILRGWIGEAG